MDEIIARPEIGKPLMYDLKGSRAVYLPPFRIIYHFNENMLLFLDFEKRDKIYR